MGVDDSAIEAAAKAMYEVEQEGGLDLSEGVYLPWSDLSAPWKDAYRQKVRAALPLLRVHFYREAADALDNQAGDREGYWSGWHSAASFLRSCSQEGKP